MDLHSWFNKLTHAKALKMIGEVESEVFDCKRVEAGGRAGLDSKPGARRMQTWGLCTAAFLASTAFMTGCAVSNQTYGPTGKVAHTISCKGAMNSISNCFDKAGDICGKAGYDLLMQEGTATPFGIASGYANSSGSSFTGFGGSAVSRSIMVQCKAPPSPEKSSS